jgi:hypothetical protein
MRNRIIFLLVLGGFCLGTRAAVLPAEKLLPKDTALVVTTPDCAAGWTLLTNTPYSRMWQDPALKPFKDKFMEKFTSEVVKPLERSLNVQFSSYSGLAQGQATLAMIPVSQPEQPDKHFAWILLLDTKDQAARLRSNLAEIRQKWANAGKPMKSHQIRDIDFTTLVLSASDLSLSKILKSKDAPAPDNSGEPVSTNKTELTFGQADSLLLVSDSPALIEKILSRQAGGLVPALEENPAFQTDFAARLHDAPLYVWANVKEAMDILTKLGDDNGDDAAKPNVLLTATGLSGLTSASLTYRSTPEGLSVQFFVGVPEGKRTGVIKALVAEAHDSNPPGFVPADAAKFWRWRLGIPHAWQQIESVANDIDPRYGSAINFVLQNAGKDKDPNYDLKSQLLGNIGNDIIHYEKAPRGATLAEINSAPSIYLIGSPDPEKLANAIKIGLSIMGTTKDRDFLGRKIYTLNQPQAPGNAPARALSFAGSGGYVALSTDTAMLEEYLRSADNKGKPLSETPGLSEAAQKVGGMGSGLFGFEDQSQTTKVMVEALRSHPISLQDILGSSTTLGPLNAADSAAKLRDWTDFSLLPPFDAISKYFYFTVFSGSFGPDGFTMNFFSPTPPKLR